MACLVAAAVWWGWDRVGPPLPEPAELGEMDPEVAEIIRQALVPAKSRRGNEDFRLQLGMVYEANGLRGFAKICYEQVLEARPDDIKAWYRLGYMRLHAGDFAGAIEAMDRVTELDPQFVAAYTQSGLWLLDSGNAARAERQLHHAIELDPDDEAALLGLVLLHLQRRQPDEAIALLKDEQLLKRRNHKYAYRLLAMAHRQRDDLPSAQRALAQTGDLRPDWSDPYARELAGLKAGTRNKRAAARAMMRQGKYEEAVPLLVRARLDDPGNTRILNTLATCHLELERFDACLATFRAALLINPDDYWTNVNLANAYWVMSQSRPVDLPRALARADRAIQLRPDSGQARSTKGRILMAMNRPAEAIDVLKEAFALDARDASILTQAGFLQCDLERWDQAVDTFGTALEHDALSATPLVGLARAYMGRGEIAEAQAALDAARTRRQDHPHLLEAAAKQLAELKQAVSSSSPPPETDGSEGEI